MAEPDRLVIRHEGEADTYVEYHCTANIGVALFLRDEASQDDILNRADTAMYQAKGDGGNLVRFYDLWAWQTYEVWSEIAGTSMQECIPRRDSGPVHCGPSA